MPALLRRTSAGAAAVVLTMAALTACSGDSEEPEASETASDSASASPTPSPSASPSSVASPDPELPEAPPAKNTGAGQEAFAEFVIDRWSYALQTNDATAVTELSPKSGPCGGCPELEAELKRRKKQGWYVDFPGARIVKLQVAPGAVPPAQVATATINVPASESYFEDGELRNENAAHKGATFEVQMRLDGKRYSLLAFRVS
jgi:Family of unknown function (DUF6318)